MIEFKKLFATSRYNSLKRSLDGTPRELQRLQQAVVDTPFQDKLLTTAIDLGIVVLLRVNKRDGTIDRVALSNTELAQGAVRVSAKPFHEIRIPLSSPDNIIARTIVEQQPYITDDWQDLFTPALKPEEARLNQKGASIETSMVVPLKEGDGGALIFSFYQPKAYIGKQHRRFALKYASMVDQALSTGWLPDSQRSKKHA